MIKTQRAPKAQIQDENGIILGMIKGDFVTYGCSLIGKGGKIVVKLRRKSLFKHDMFMEDSNKKIIGIVEHEKEVVFLKNKNQDIVLTGALNEEKCQLYEISDTNDNLIASFSMLDTGSLTQRWFKDWNTKYILHVHDLSFDRTVLLGFFSCIHYKLTRSDLHWYEYG